MNKPWLSIGMIVKNEIRSIEKCLKALQPLRDAFPCELVIADTGSTDGTREIAEKYADILFDFEWINDFAAARNAVMDRCSGEWYFSVDADEYLDPDLTDFYQLRELDRKGKVGGAYITIINYANRDMNIDESSNFLGQRLIKLSKEIRYQGKIHESIVFPKETQGVALHKAILHHDGYAYENREQMLKKCKRNLELLDQELEEHPEDMRRWMQCLESAAGMPEQRIWYAKKAMKILLGKDLNTQTPLMDSAVGARCVEAGVDADLPEVETWMKWLYERYPDALIVRVDATVSAISWNSKKERYQQVIKLADIYQKAIDDWKAKRYKPGELTSVLILRTQRAHIESVRYLKSVALLKLDRLSEAFDAISDIDFRKQKGNLLITWVKTMMHLLDDSRVTQKIARAEDYFSFYEEDEEDSEAYKKWEENRNTFFSIGVKSFLYTKEQSDGIDRPWRVFKDCKGILGQNARILLSGQSDVVQEIVNDITEWQYVPSVIQILIFKLGVRFPPAFYKQSTTWRAQVIKNLITQDEDFIEHILQRESVEKPDLVSLQFRIDLLAAALQDQKNFAEDKNNLVDQLNRRFSNLTHQYFERIYNKDFIEDDSDWDILPGTSCFILYLLQAEKQRQSGDSTGYIHTLRKALQKAEGMKYFVEYLAEKEMDQQKMQQASPELLQLADKVKAILSQYPEDDPAVQQLKSSEVYQKVAWLIEQPSADYQM